MSNSLLPNNNQLEDISNDPSFLGIKAELLMRKKLDPFVDYIIIQKGRGGVWAVVDTLLQFMATYYPQELKDVIEDVKRDRLSAANEWAETKKGMMRKLGSMPDRLWIMLKRAYEGEVPIPPREFKREFFKRYPAFRVTKKI